MKKHFVYSTLLAVLVLLVVASTASAKAVKHSVSGTYGIVSVYGDPTNVHQVGKFCSLEVDAEYPFYGDLEGTAYLHFWVLIHGSCDAPFFTYKENYKATGTFVGTVLGDNEGTLDLFYQGRGWPAEYGAQAISSKIIIRSGTDDLEGAKGVLDVCYLLGSSVDTYEGHVILK